MPETITAEDRGSTILPPLTETAFTPAGKRVIRKAYSSGPDMGWSGLGKVVAFAIRVRADCKVGDRDFSADVNLHEVVMLRRYYEELGGGQVRISPEWPPMLNRVVPLTQEQLKAELTRLMDNFVIPRTNSVLVVPTVYLGTEPGEQMRRLHEVMRKQLDAWTKTVEKALDRLGSARPADPEYALAAAFEAVTGRELEEIANIADPSRDGIGDLELPEVLQPKMDAALASSSPTMKDGEPASQLTPEAAMKMIEEEEQPADGSQKMVERLVAKAELNQQQALAVATLVELMGGDVPDAELADAIGSKAKGRLEAVRRALKG